MVTEWSDLVCGREGTEWNTLSVTGTVTEWSLSGVQLRAYGICEITSNFVKEPAVSLHWDSVFR